MEWSPTAYSRFPYCIRFPDSKVCHAKAYFDIFTVLHYQVNDKKSNKSPSSALQASTILHVAQKTENIEEEVDEIEIETDCSHNVLIGGEAAVDEVCVIDDIPTE
jgi:hypothetical protein